MCDLSPDEFTLQEQEYQLKFHVKPTRRHIAVNLFLLNPITLTAYALVAAVLWLQYKNAMFTSSQTLYSAHPYQTTIIDCYGVELPERNLSFPEYFAMVLTNQTVPSMTHAKTAIMFASRFDYKITAETIREVAWRLDEYGVEFVEMRWVEIKTLCVYWLCACVYVALARYERRQFADDKVRLQSKIARLLMHVSWVTGVIFLCAAYAGVDTRSVHMGVALEHAIALAPDGLTETGADIAYSPCVPVSDDEKDTRCIWLVREYTFDELVVFVDTVYEARDRADALFSAYLALAITWTVWHAMILASSVLFAWTSLVTAHGAMSYWREQKVKIAARQRRDSERMPLTQVEDRGRVRQLREQVEDPERLREKFLSQLREQVTPSCPDSEGNMPESAGETAEGAS